MKQNEIWLINLDPTIGAQLKIAPWMIKISPSKKNGLMKISSIDCFQMRSVSETRFVKKLGKIEGPTAEKIKIALLKVLSIL